MITVLPAFQFVSIRENDVIVFFVCCLFIYILPVLLESLACLTHRVAMLGSVVFELQLFLSIENA